MENDRRDVTVDVKNENELSSESQEQNFEFMTETIKERPINKRRMLLKTLFTCILGLVFGVIACVTFVLLQPYVQNYFYPVDNTKVVTLNNAEEEIESEEIKVDNIKEVKEQAEAVLDEKKQEEPPAEDKNIYPREEMLSM